VWHPSLETNASDGSLRARYVRAGETLLAAERSGATRFFHADQLGSTRALSNTSGSITDSYHYNPWGEVTAHSGSDTNAYLFAGEPFDGAARLSYNRARWFDPGLGRFLSRDPWSGEPVSPATLARFDYAGSRPTVLRDPTGWFFCTAPGGTLGEMAAFGTAAHTAISNDFLRSGIPGDLRADRPIYELLGQPWSITRLLRPDLTARRPGGISQIWEIKPFNNAAVGKGLAQLAVKGGILNREDGASLWLPGYSYSGGKVLLVGGSEIVTVNVCAGIIGYCDKNQVITTVVAVAAIAAIAMLQEQFGIALIPAQFGYAN
jgi:RHS repeat-associated protein